MGTSDGGYSCEICGATFDKPGQLGGHKTHHQQSVSREELLQQIRDVAGALPRPPTVTEIIENGGYGKSPFRREFGTVANARDAAGIDVDRWTVKSATQEELLDEIRRLAETYGEVPTSEDMREDGEYSIKPFETQFGGWTEAVEAAGMVPRRRTALSDEQLLDELRELGEELGRTPTRRDMAEKGKSGGTTYSRRFGSWNEALRRAGLSTNHEIDTRVPVDCEQCGQETLKKPSRIKEYERHFCSGECYWDHRRAAPYLKGENNPNWSGGRAPYGPGWNDEKKSSVRERDGCKCQVCGLRQKEHLKKHNRKLDVHHIIPAAEFDEDDRAKNHPDNLVTLCLGCHRKWEGVPLRPDIAN